MCEALVEAGVEIAAIYHYPHLASGSIPAYAIDCDCRRPGPGMLRAAAAELVLDMANSVIVGGRASDLEAGAAAGVRRGFLVRKNGHVASVENGVKSGVLTDLAAAVDQLLDAPSAFA